jgi:hypothetical protein
MWIYEKEARRNGRKLLEIKNTLYTSMRILVQVIKLRSMGRAGHTARLGESRGVYRVLVGLHEGKRTFGRHRRRWEDNIKMYLQDVGCGDMD